MKGFADHRRGDTPASLIIRVAGRRRQPVTERCQQILGHSIGIGAGKVKRKVNAGN